MGFVYSRMRDCTRMRPAVASLLVLSACRGDPSSAPSQDPSVVVPVGPSTPPVPETASASAPQTAAPPLTAPPASTDTDWAQKLGATEAKASFEHDLHTHMPGTKFTESAGNVSITYGCTYEAISVARTPAGGWKASVTARLASDLVMGGPPVTHAEDEGIFAFVPTGQAGRWTCDPGGYVHRGKSPPLGVPCMNIRTECLGRHASPEEFDAALGP
jgi:hypothetical protein